MRCAPERPARLYRGYTLLPRPPDDDVTKLAAIEPRSGESVAVSPRRTNIAGKPPARHMFDANASSREGQGRAVVVGVACNDRVGIIEGSASSAPTAACALILTILESDRRKPINTPPVACDKLMHPALPEKLPSLRRTTRRAIVPGPNKEGIMMRTGDILKSPFGGWIGYVGIGAIALGCTDATLSPDADGPAVEATSLAQTAMAPAPSSEAVAAASSCAPVPALAWQPCGEAYPGVECATARVPLDYDQPRGASTTIALARVLAADKSKRIGSVFVNPGGPGGSGVGLILRGFGDYLGSMLAGHFDIVGFDPRGVGASEPLICFDSNDELSELLSLVPSFPYRPMQELPFFNLYRSIAERCFERRARILPHMSTANVARDLDLLRQAVGDKAITYLGFSYGSMLGTTYANLFPSKIRALVIDGVIDPQLWVAGRQIDADRVATGQEFAEFLRLCDEADTDCALSGPDGAGARFYSLAAALRHAPIVFGDGTTYGYDHLIGDAIFAMYEPEQWGGENGYGAFFAYLADAVLENADAARQVLVVRSAIKARRERESPRREPYDNSAEGFYGTMCADAEFPRFFHDWQMIGDWAERGSIFGAYWWWSNTGCGPLYGPYVGSRADHRQLLRRRHRLQFRREDQQAATEQPSAQLRGLGPHRLRPQRLRHAAHPRLSSARQVAARRDSLPGQPQSVRSRAGRASRRREGSPNDRTAAILVGSAPLILRPPKSLPMRPRVGWVFQGFQNPVKRAARKSSGPC